MNNVNEMKIDDFNNYYNLRTKQLSYIKCSNELYFDLSDAFSLHELNGIYIFFIRITILLFQIVFKNTSKVNYKL